MDETVERMMQRKGVGLLADQIGTIFEAQVANIISQQVLHIA